MLRSTVISAVFYSAQDRPFGNTLPFTTAVKVCRKIAFSNFMYPETLNTSLSLHFQ